MSGDGGPRGLGLGLLIAAAGLGGLLVTAALSSVVPVLLLAVEETPPAPSVSAYDLPTGPDVDAAALVDELTVDAPPDGFTADAYGTTAMVASTLVDDDEVFGIAIAGQPTVLFPALDLYDDVTDTASFVRALEGAGYLGGGLVTVTHADERDLPGGALVEVVVDDVVVADGAPLAGFGPVDDEVFGDDEDEVFQFIIGGYRQTWWVFDDAGLPIVVVVELPTGADDRLADAVEAQALAWADAVGNALTRARAATTPTAAAGRSERP